MQKLNELWGHLPGGVRRVVHTFWQVALPVLLSHLLLARSSADVKATVVLAGATGLAAVKAVYFRS
jgi:hypothetical protein